jgi:site-specific recombinase XerD
MDATCATWYRLAGGADIQTVKERLGHGSLRTTEKYLHTLPDTDDTALNALHRTRTAIPKGSIGTPVSVSTG